jgi:hypothetical protein
LLAGLFPELPSTEAGMIEGIMALDIANPVVCRRNLRRLQRVFEC